MRWRFMHWLLAALLASGQLALLAHQSDIDTHADGEPCSICLLAHGSNNALPACFTLSLDILEPPVFVPADFSSGIRHSTDTPQIRGPPLRTRYS
ncbi:MAG: hypothetical protein ACWGNB_01430 [Thiogranum sp.]